MVMLAHEILIVRYPLAITWQQLTITLWTFVDLRFFDSPKHFSLLRRLAVVIYGYAS